MSTPTIIQFDDPRGGLAYPFLPDSWQWQIVSRPLRGNGSLAQIARAEPPTLRWVKDDKVLDLYVPGMDSQAFFEATGLQSSLDKGGYALSKRLSRLMRLYRTWGFYQPDRISIAHSAGLDGALWDGSGLVSRTFVEQLAETSQLTTAQRRAFLTSSRFEVTVMHAGGQEKGHVLAVDDLACDFLFPAGSAKGELSLRERVFVGLTPVHSQDQMCLDIQSLINLHPFFQTEQLLAWMQMESGLFLQSIRSGQLEAVLNRLPGVSTAAGLAALADWHVAEYIASGGRLMWFAGMVKTVARQHLNRLGARERKQRFPIPGGRYYLFPAEVGQRRVPPGQITLDPATATAWVNDQDWRAFIADVLGGCDGDDAVWVFPFRDAAEGPARDSARDTRKVLVWRSPNQPGEYVLLRPTAGSHTLRWAVPGGTLAYPTLDCSRLPPRIDTLATRYERLPTEAGSDDGTTYSVAALWPTVERAAANQGTLGAYCNTLMLTRALYGRLPERLPARLEEVIDGSVKTGLDLAPVRAWTERAAEAIVRQGRPVPTTLRDRLAPLLPDKLQAHVRISSQDGATRHWLDVLEATVSYHCEAYQADVAALASEACPPLTLFEHGRDWLVIGRELNGRYGQAMRLALGAAGQAEAVDEAEEAARVQQALDAARTACEQYLAQWPANRQSHLLLGAAAAAYASGSRDSQPAGDQALWQLGQQQPGGGRHPGLAQAFLQALREIGLLGEPVWTAQGAVLYYPPATQLRRAGVPLSLNGTWFNWLRHVRPETPASMSQVPAETRAWAKARLADLAATRFAGLRLTMQVTAEERVLAWTEHNHLFGYVTRGQELQAVRHPVWEICWAAAVDGNVQAILQPARS